MPSKKTKRGRKRKPKLSKTALKKQHVKMVIDLVRKGATVTRAVSKIANKYNEDPEVLRRRVYDNAKRTESNHGNALLTHDQELGVLGVLTGFAAINHPLSQSQATKLIKEVSHSTNKYAGRATLNRLKNAHSDLLQPRTSQALVPKRQGMDMKRVGVEFADCFGKLLETGLYNSHQIFNIDETGAQIDGSSSHEKRIVLSNHRKAAHNQGSMSKAINVIPIVSADGAVPLVFLLIPDSERHGETFAPDIVVHKQGSTRSRGPKIRYIFNHSGKLDGEVWKIIVRIFVDEWKEMHADLPAILLVDHDRAHENLDAVQYALQNDCKCLYFPPGSTNWTQPLDDVIFANFKDELKRRVADAQTTDFGTPEPVQKTISKYLPGVIKEKLTKPQVLASFKHTGIWPWNRNLFLKHADRAAENPKIKNAPKSKVFQVNFNAVLKAEHKELQTGQYGIKGRRTRRDVAYTGEQLLARRKKNQKRKIPAKKSKRGKKKQRQETHEEEYQRLCKEGEKRLMKRKNGKGVRDGDAWNDENWVKSNTCAVCRAVLRGGPNWNQSLCRNFLLCYKHVSCGRHALEEHEGKCADCLRADVDGAPQSSSSSSEESD